MVTVTKSGYTILASIAKQFPDSEVVLFNKDLLLLGYADNDVLDLPTSGNHLIGQSVYDVIFPTSALHLLQYYIETLRGNSKVVKFSINDADYRLQFFPIMNKYGERVLAGSMVVQALHPYALPKPAYANPEYA